jgi:hypothetical protein
MYRDDQVALLAQVRTLKARLEAEQKAREAAEAAEVAARAAADEARLAAKKGGDRPPDKPLWRRHWPALLLLVIALPIAVYAIHRLQSSKKVLLVMEAKIRETERLTAKLTEELNAERDRSKQALARCESLSSRRPPPVRYSQRGAEVFGEDDPGSPPRTLSRSQIMDGMRSVKPTVQACYERYKVPGLANVQVKIGNGGRVEKARTRGLFSDTPTGQCVAAAVRGARFPRFTGEPITITYPFILR